MGSSQNEIPLPPTPEVRKKMPWIQLGEVDPASTLTPPPALFPESSKVEQRAAMRFSVSGNAVFTGGTGVLALASARALLEHGLSGIALLDLPAALDKGAAEVNSLRQNFPEARVLTHACDVTNAQSMDDIAQRVQNELGSVNILCCFAGIVNCADAKDLPVEQWRRVVDVNMTGSWISAQAFGRHMIASGRGGNIVLIASISGHRVNYPQPQVAYNVSKAGVLHMRNSLAAEWTRYGIRVNSISPGYMDTVLNEGADLEQWRQIWAERNPMRRMGSPQEITGPVVFLCSDIGGSYVNGTDIVVDGGGLVF
ncbi:hypothetical protein BDV25DRAFT_163509 [Aspergillus avenaceus]|uniref:D-arabinitol 2-dehydrogenase [ribulose-forming] n=1 Tax=Aspergillus avenaceus TaxID=36643 RepID=A0A5N6THT2_ASPAV|nr:hypothetical protein BDV25DRAFT_163509 [Aspergillus avenaceus]